ncbi:MAG: hypothetical protein EOR12_27105 [Mesorhizobium sp.]|uniref:hypothetical protein n=1 Tax=Mesorhizobium sp. TaxID=1871066 RepID=UPI000FEA7D77|nr:hypothetical protein [Mesorhizobium sp.]RWP84902.1 MAG: hypothetical protein EOR12_27105 [Mesorhizobium sp.]
MTALLNPFILSAGGDTDPPDSDELLDGDLVRMDFENGVYWGNGAYQTIADLLSGYDESEIIATQGMLIRNAADNLNWPAGTSLLRNIWRNHIASGFVVTFDFVQSSTERGILFVQSDAENLGNDHWSQGNTYPPFEGDTYIGLDNEELNASLITTAYNEAGHNKIAYLINGTGPVEAPHRFIVACNGLSATNDIASFLTLPDVVQLLFMAAGGDSYEIDGSDDFTPSETYVRSIRIRLEMSAAEMETYTTV